MLRANVWLGNYTSNSIGHFERHFWVIFRYLCSLGYTEKIVDYVIEIPAD